MAECVLSDADQIEEIDDVKDEHSDFLYTITSYGADYPVDALIKRLKSGDISIPKFQRAYVWGHQEASRFIESLLLGLPVPGIFVAKESDTGKLLVIDGHQRLKTLEFFYDNNFNSKDNFALDEVNAEFLNATYSTLKEEYRRRLDDSIIHLTIVRQDEPTDDNSSVYQIFERLNSGGRKLEQQEIRACIYHGEFNDLLSELNKKGEWRTLIRRKGAHIHLKDSEMILRFFALFFQHGSYEKPMKTFLNDFMSSNRHLNKYSKDILVSLFNKTIDIVYRNLDRKVFVLSSRINVALFDAIMVGIATRLEKGEILNGKLLQEKYNALLEDKEFFSSCIGGTTDESAVGTRVTKAIAAFDEVN